MGPSPSPSPKWLQLSGPQIGTAGMGLARCPPPSRVCLQERKPAHLWNPSLSPRSASPTCPPGAWGQPPRSVSLFPGPSPITMRVVFTVAQLPLHQPPSCLRAHGLPVLPPPPHGVSYLSKCSGLASWPGLTCHTDPNRRFQMGCQALKHTLEACSTEQRETVQCLPVLRPNQMRPSRGWPGRHHLQTYHFLTRLLLVHHALHHTDHPLRPRVFRMCARHWGEGK